MQGLLAEKGLHTVCEDAKCPNRVECWNRGTATLMILGDVCTRNCKFCAVKSGNPEKIDTAEPGRVVAAASAMNLQHLVLTSVTRDDLADGGAGVFADCIERMRWEMPDTTVEVLIPDFRGDAENLETVLAAGPAVLNHNIETVKRLQADIRPQASYEGSMQVLKRSAQYSDEIAVKSGMMVGLGETDGEVFETLRDLFGAGCRFLTVGQYLAPSDKHWPADRYVPPERFREYAEWARSIGFEQVESAPLVRSSYRAAEMLNNYKRCLEAG